MQFIFGTVIICPVFLILVLLLFFSQYVVYVDRNNAFWMQIQIH